jgi:antitoxin (DNA-binding transcriptional repressor) of toxin-antitoxin stability system
MRRLQAGESFTVTNRGTVIGFLIPASRSPRLPITRPATARGFDGLPLCPPGDTPVAVVLDELRQDR